MFRSVNFSVQLGKDHLDFLYPIAVGTRRRSPSDHIRRLNNALASSAFLWTRQKLVRHMPDQGDSLEDRHSERRTCTLSYIFAILNLGKVRAAFLYGMWELTASI